MRKGDSPEISPDKRAAREVGKALDGSENKAMRSLRKEAGRMRDIAGGSEERRREYESRQLDARAKDMAARPGPERTGVGRDSRVGRPDPPGERHEPGSFEPRGLKSRDFRTNDLIRDARRRQPMIERTEGSLPETGERRLRSGDKPVSPERQGEQRRFKDGEVLRRYPAKDSGEYQLSARSDTGGSWDMEARRVEKLSPQDRRKQAFDGHDLARGRDQHLGESVGYCKMEMHKDPQSGKNAAEIVDIKINNPEHRRSGHGTEMLRRAERDARERGADRIWAEPGAMTEPGRDGPNADRDALRAFYEKNRYQWTGSKFEKNLMPEA